MDKNDRVAEEIQSLLLNTVNEKLSKAKHGLIGGTAKSVAAIAEILQREYGRDDEAG